LKRTYPDAAVDLLVFEGTEGVVSANPDLRQVITIPQRPRFIEHVALHKKLWRRYDLALSAQASDRSTLYAWASAPIRVGILVPERQAWWKRQLLTTWVKLDNLTTHTLSMNLRLLDVLGISPVATPVIGWSQADEERAHGILAASATRTYAVLHVSPKFSYKQWTTSGWIELARWLNTHGLKVIVTAGNSEQEVTYASNLIGQLPQGSVNLAGKVSLSILGCLLSGATLYIGTDTAVTHMAAALGVPTVALFGPSNPIKWGPWPKSWPATAQSPWKFRGSQRQGNVYLLQGDGDCVPCLHEGCDRHVNSLSDCLQHLQARRVIEAVEQVFQSEKRLTLSIY
jgi:heptosyltransferase-3